jgi:enoyl-CoA hydratase
VLTGRRIDAAEAERAGLVSRVVSADKLMDEAFAVADTLCALGLPSLMAAKECVNRSFESGLTDGMAYERRMFHMLFGSEDQREGMGAFLDKRKAAFTHR